MKVQFVINSLASTGGAERVITTMANYWAEKGWNITIATFCDGKLLPAYELSPEVKYFPLNIAGKSSNSIEGLINNTTRIRHLNKFFKKENPDIIISFSSETNIMALLSTLSIRLPVIVSERNYPGNYTLDPVRIRLRKWLYPNAFRVVCQTQGMLDYFMPVIKGNGVVIPNPVTKPNIFCTTPEVNLPEGKLLFAVGSMSKTKVHQKGYDLLIPVFDNLAEKHKDWNLVIMGDGPERTTLKKWVEGLSLGDRVYLPGNVKDVYSVLSKGDLFVLSSRYEGFPNALCEAMASGLPAVSYDCPTGPGDIIRDGIDGMLVSPGNKKSMTTALDHLMGNSSLRKSMGKNAIQIVNRFSLGKVMGMWEDSIMAALSSKADIHGIE